MRLAKATNKGARTFVSKSWQMDNTVAAAKKMHGAVA
jgi:hypothetical protein